MGPSLLMPQPNIGSGTKSRGGSAQVGSFAGGPGPGITYTGKSASAGPGLAPRAAEEGAGAGAALARRPSVTSGLKDPGGKSDRIIRIFAHQNSVKILSEFRKNSQNSSETLKILRLLNIF